MKENLFAYFLAAILAFVLTQAFVKGGPPTGLYLQVVDDTGDELEIPGRPFGFGKLIRAQAAGDLGSLRERGRRVARIRLEDA